VIQPFLVVFFRQILKYFFFHFQFRQWALTHLKPLHPKVKGRMRENEAFSRNRHSLPGKLGRLLILTILNRKGVVPLSKTLAQATHDSNYCTLSVLAALAALATSSWPPWLPWLPWRRDTNRNDAISLTFLPTNFANVQKPLTNSHRQSFKVEGEEIALLWHGTGRLGWAGLGWAGLGWAGLG
jgi:hypothetical protein